VGKCVVRCVAQTLVVLHISSDLTFIAVLSFSSKHRLRLLSILKLLVWIRIENSLSERRIGRRAARAHHSNTRICCSLILVVTQSNRFVCLLARLLLVNYCSLVYA